MKHQLAIGILATAVAATDTVESVQAEIDLLQSRFDEIFYPNFTKFLDNAFHTQPLPFGGHVENGVIDDVLKFYETGD